MILDLLSENLDERPNFSSFLPAPSDPHSFSCVATRAGVIKQLNLASGLSFLQPQIFMCGSGLEVTTSPSTRYVLGPAL